jgi:hypothetical protein
MAAIADQQLLKRLLRAWDPMYKRAAVCNKSVPLLGVPWRRWALFRFRSALPTRRDLAQGVRGPHLAATREGESSGKPGEMRPRSATKKVNSSRPGAAVPRLVRGWYQGRL